MKVGDLVKLWKGPYKGLGVIVAMKSKRSKKCTVLWNGQPHEWIKGHLLVLCCSAFDQLQFICVVRWADMIRLAKFHRTQTHPIINHISSYIIWLVDINLDKSALSVAAHANQDCLESILLTQRVVNANAMVVAIIKN